MALQGEFQVLDMVQDFDHKPAWLEVLYYPKRLPSTNVTPKLCSFDDATVFC